MSTETNQVGSHQRLPISGVMLRIGYFLLHYLEMCLVMCIGGIGIFSALLRRGGKFIGYSEPTAQFPELSTLMLALWMALLMIAWMRFRGHKWRPTLEMAGTSIAALPLLIGAAWLGAIPMTSLYGLECGLACVFMVVAMLFRLDHYTGQHASHSRHPGRVADPDHEHSCHTG